MKKILYSWVYIIILFGFCNCNKIEEKNPLDGTFISPNYVQVYKIASSISGEYQSDCNAIMLTVHGTTITEMNGPEFITLSNNYKDISYNERVSACSGFAIANEFDGIEIVSDKDFSEELPAGSSLSGIVKLCGLSPLKYLESNYNQPFDWVENQPEDFKQDKWSENYDIRGSHGYYPVNNLISELDKRDLLLLDPHFFFLRFTEKSDVKSHKITVTLKEGENSFSTTVDVVFE